MRAGWRFNFGWERARQGDEPRRRFPWVPVIVVLAILAGASSIASTVLSPAAPAPAPVAHYVTISPSPNSTVPVTNVSLNARTGALCIVPTGKPGKHAVVVRVP